MPHIDSNFKYRKMAFRLKESFKDKKQERYDKITSTITPNNPKQSIFNLIEEIVDKTMAEFMWSDNSYFNQFVDIKEAPFGRTN